MKFTFNREGKIEEVAMERWAWGIIYEDGTELRQFGDDGTFHQVGEIEQERIKMAMIYKTGEDNVPAGKPMIMIPWRKGMKLIHKYRNIRPAGHPKFIKVYMFGYKDGSHYHYNFVLPDDRIISCPFDNIDLTKFGIIPKKTIN